MQFFRLLHRRTKSEGDVSTLLFQPTPAVAAPVFVPLQASLPSFDPTHELYTPPINSVQSPVLPEHVIKLNSRIIQLETQLACLQDERTNHEQDLADYRADLLHTRTELYSEMLRSARHQQLAMDDFRTVQRLEARHQRFCALLVDIGIPSTTVDTICQVIQSGNGSPDDILVDAIRDATKDDGTLLARLKPIVTEERTPEHYQSALNLTLSVRKDLKFQKKRSKFWKKLAQENDQHANTITPSPSDISSIRQDLSPERQCAVDALIARRRSVRYPEHSERDVFGGRRRESALDTLASSLASRPRRSTQDDLRLSSSFSSSASSASTQLSYLSRIPRDPATETPTILSRLPSTLSRRASRGSSQSVVLGSRDMNVSRSSSVDPTLPEEPEQNDETGPTSTVTFSQDLLQNDRRASQGHGHRRIPSTSLRRSLPVHSNRSSFRFSAFSPSEACRTMDVFRSAIDTASFDTPGVMLRFADIPTNMDIDTPAPSETTQSEDTPFNDTCVLPKCNGTPFSPTALETRVASTPIGDDVEGPVVCKALEGDTHFLVHLDSSMSMATSMSTFASVAASEAGAHAQDGHDHEPEHERTRTGPTTGNIPLGESSDSLFSASASASVTSSATANDTPAPATPPTPSRSSVPGSDCISSPSTPPSGGGTGTGVTSVKRSMLPVLAKHLKRLSFSGTPSPDRERFMGKLRGLRSLSKSRSRSRSVSGSGSAMSPLASPPGASRWRRSPARSDSSRSERLILTANLSPSPSPRKGSGIPVLQRRMTIRARRMSMRNA